MKLYHGTNCDFTEIDFSKCKPNKDFGKGFYLTDMRKQALDMAIRRCEFEQSGTPIVQEYYFDEKSLNNGDFKVKIFKRVCVEWAEFILQNRTSKKEVVHGYDIVVGPVADDGVVYQLNLYMQHFITIEQLVKGLEYKRLNNQYFFGTDKAISKLKRI